MDDDGPEVRLRRGSLLIGPDVYQTYFAGLEGVVLMRRDDDLLILPVRHLAAGGYLLKLRSPRGDRVVTATDFFHTHHVDHLDDVPVPVAWRSDLAALVAPGVFSPAK